MRGPRGLAILAAVLAGPSLLAGCSAADDGPSAEEAGALAAVRAYVEAIADGDAAAADAMTDPEAFDAYSGSDGDVDVRRALGRAADHITDPWVLLAGRADDLDDDASAYAVDVSWHLRELTGGGRVVVTLRDDDPADVDSWQVTEPLVASAETYSDLDEALLGGVGLTYGSTRHAGVWGYPGGYLLQAQRGERAEPLWVAVGAADATTWDVSLPVLGGD